VSTPTSFAFAFFSSYVVNQTLRVHALPRVLCPQRPQGRNRVITSPSFSERPLVFGIARHATACSYATCAWPRLTGLSLSPSPLSFQGHALHQAKFLKCARRRPHFPRPTSVVPITLGHVIDVVLPPPIDSMNLESFSSNTCTGSLIPLFQLL